MIFQRNKAWSLYRYFFKISWFTFGGGWNIVAQIQKDYADKPDEISTEELLDIVSVGRSLPGTMIGNVAYLFGHHLAGIPGGILSVLGIITPPLILLSIVTLLYNNFSGNSLIAKMLTGVRAVVAPIILSALLKLYKGAFPHRYCHLLCIVGCILSLFFNLNCMLIILIGIITGFILNNSQKGENI
ncbi:MAG: chromate transporter [Thermoflexaceae bacterium]|nr:chromate transporter [Thermoflexaceae bacterium]